MEFTIKAKLTIVSERDGRILIPGAIHSYTNTLLESFNSVKTKALLDGTMTKSKFITEVQKNGELMLGRLVALHFISTHKDLSFGDPWVVNYDFMSLEIH